ncbi:hypothetical protein E2C01_004555 [Portunus trituberculatus]|uniref:Uncharacterized protein n=1 Tax=Portunus trituberculatus TaxID=210409 RepID=A0A5B7CR02_PORTR|nr:hypothetical protein [Portunus trituberculatus]
MDEAAVRVADARAAHSPPSRPQHGAAEVPTRGRAHQEGTVNEGGPPLVALSCRLDTTPSGTCTPPDAWTPERLDCGWRERPENSTLEAGRDVV